MKKSIFLMVLMGGIVFFGCQDDKAKLAGLKANKEKLDLEIQTLEQKIAQTDSTFGKNIKSTLVATMAVQPDTFRHYIEVQGKLDGDENLDVFPEAMATVERVLIQAGQQVGKGAVLAQLNDAAQREQLKSLESNYALASQVYEKQKTLWDQQIGSEVQFLQAKTNKESLEAQISALKKQIDMLKVKSPISGTVEMVNLKVGQTASPSMVAFRVVNFSTVKVVATVSEAYASKINDGDKVVIEFPDINYTTEGTLSFVSRYVSPVNRTFDVEVRVSKVDPKMKANMVSVLKIVDYQNNNAVVLPINNVLADQTESYVYLSQPKDGKFIAAKTIVKTGQMYNGKIEITQGLKSSDKVITTGFQNLKDGDYIRF